MAVNYTDNVIERLVKILKAEFKTSINIFKTDRSDIHKKTICLAEGLGINEHTWAPNILVDRIAVEIILRHPWQKDDNKKEWLNKDLHKIKVSILGSRSDSTTNWFNGLVTDSDPIEIENDDNDKPKFWKKILHFSCLIAYDRTE